MRRSESDRLASRPTHGLARACRTISRSAAWLLGILLILGPASERSVPKAAEGAASIVRISLDFAGVNASDAYPPEDFGVAERGH